MCRRTIELTTMRCPAAAIESSAVAQSAEARRTKPRPAPMKISRNTALMRVAAIMKSTFNAAILMGKNPARKSS